MLSQIEFENWCQRLNISDAARSVIEGVRSSEPARRVGGGRKNVSGRYPSKKLGFTIQFESHKVELPTIYEFEHDSSVIEFYDQPPSIKLEYLTKNARKQGVLHTPDFFVIRTDCAGWEECKTESELKEKTNQSPNRYLLDEDGEWHSPAGEKYAQQFGLYYRLRSSAKINQILQRNLTFLEDYYRRIEFITVREEVRNHIISLSSLSPGITLAELLEYEAADDIYSLIVKEQIYVNLYNEVIAERERVHIFPDHQRAIAYSLMSKTSIPIQQNSSIKLQVGNIISWDGRSLNIIFIGETEVVLRDDFEQLIKLKTTELLELVRQGKIKSISNQNQTINNTTSWERFSKASPEEQALALHRYQVIEPYLNGHPPENQTVPARTIRDWKAKYLAAQTEYGCGYIGLLSNRSSSGNRLRKLPENTLELMDKFIKEDYETLKQKRMWEVHSSLVKACEDNGCIAPSYKAFTREIHRRSNYEKTLKRQGHRAAYKHESFYWELNSTTRPHGDRPFEIGHIDHTELDVELVCSQTGRNLGKPWATFLVDAFSRRLLSVYLTFDPPSYRSCLMVLRICVQRYNYLPQIIVVDNGSEFHSVYFETLLATFECTKKHRPPAKARFGSICERLFGTSNTQFVHNLLGNTQITKQVRQVTKSVNPKKHAVWTLAFLYEYLCIWAYEVYDTNTHPALSQSPREAFIAGLARSGSRQFRIIPYDENFLMLTLPTTTTGKAKVQPGMGVKINYIYYWSQTFRNPEIENTSVPVRYDPFDAGVAYTFVRGQWVQCIAQAEFKGRSEKELKLASSELRKRLQVNAKQNKISARKLAEFLADVEAQEILLEQRIHDTESREVFRAIEGACSSTLSLKKSGDYRNYPISNDTNSPTISAAKDKSDVVTSTEKLVVYDEF